MTPEQQYQMYCDKRYLYRGFSPNKDGNTVITLNGETVCGEWLYGPVIIFKNHASILDREISISRYVFSETVGQWVATDKNGKDVFEGSIIKYRFMPNNSLQNGFVNYCEEDAYFYVDNGDEFALFNEICDIELIGDKWEMQD